MLSRFSSNLNKFSPLLGRYVSTNTGVLYNNKKPRESKIDTSQNPKNNQFNRSAKSNNNRNWQSNKTNKLVLKDEIKSVLDDLKIEQRGVISAEKYFKHRDKYDLILNSLNSDPKLDELILACQKLIELNEIEPLVAQNFNSDPLRKRTIDALKRHLKDMKDADFFIAVQFMLLYDYNNFHIVQPHLANRNKNFDLNQIIKLATILRLSKVPREETSNLYRSYLSQIRENVEQIDNIRSLKMALVIFSFEASVVKRLDSVAMRLVENSTSQECAELINSKSILRQKNLLVLEACAYNIIKKKDQDKLGVDFVQKCLLSCGVLGFNEPQFFKSLLESLSSELEKNGTNLDWLKQNSKTLESICTSIGIMKLRDDASLNALCAVLSKNKTQLPLDLIIKFIISCAHLYYKPTLNGSEKEFKELVEFVKPESFDLALKEDKVKLMNFVWSSCALDSADSNLVSTVLDESFWKPLFESMNSKELKLFLMKLLNVNLYALALIENYNGNSMPETFDITQYTQILVPPESDEKNMLIAALSSMRKTDKFVKFRLLTPFGILIDAFMVVDKKGEPCELSQSENDDLIKIAFKLTQRNDYNSINSTLNGVLSFQLRLLEELGYKTVTISKEELRSNSLTNRVSLIQKKLKKLTPSTRETQQ